MKVEHLPSIIPDGIAANGAPVLKNPADFPAKNFTRIGTNLCLLYDQEPSAGMKLSSFYVWDLKSGEIIYVMFKDAAGGLEKFGGRGSMSGL